MKVNKEDVIKQIKEGKSYSEIARQYNVRPSTIGYYGQQMGIRKAFRTPQDPHRIWHVTTIDKYLMSHNSTIRRNFNHIDNVKSQVEWHCNLCNNTWKASWDSLRQRKSLKGCPNCSSSPYTVFHDILDSINPLSCYFLGVFAARGIITNGLKVKKISFSNQNKDKLEKLAKIISCTYPIRETIHRNKKIYRLSFHSNKIVNKLKELNITKKEIPSVIPQELMHHFIRGYLDFKGYIERLGGDIKIRTNIAGNPILVSQIKKIYSKINNKANGHITQKEKNQAEFHIAGLPSNYKFLNWLYNTDVNTLKYVDNEKYNDYLYTKNLMTVKQTLQTKCVEDRKTLNKNLQAIKQIFHKKRIQLRKKGAKEKLPFLNTTFPKDILSRRRQQPFFRDVVNKINS